MNIEVMDRLKLLLELYENDQSDPFTQFAIGFEYHKSGRLQDALRWYELVLSTDPDYTGVYYHLGKLYVDLERIEDANEIYKKGIEVCIDLHEDKDRCELQLALMALEDD
ncbi:MAG: tetratricopeptide repeat protein [Bacteroidetes bacterium]|nr:tetratricopeptide repeat protein [Bacteroidota bacterium]MCY4233856.1 tetratricopeptide repeat protein [Bacteroidota bacterium]